MLSVYIPAYNEERIIADTVAKVSSALKGSDYELFIVDDSSIDCTRQICENLAKRSKRIKYLRYDNGPTRRENLADSFKLARGEHVAFIDADLSSSPKYLLPMAKLLGRYDIVVASRNLSDSKIERKAWRHIFNTVSSNFIRAYFGSKISDHQCGLKAFRRDVLKSLVSEAGYDRSRWRGWSWDTEILIRAQRRGCKIHEMPIEWRESAHSSVIPTKDWKIMPYIISLKMRL